MVIGVGRAHQSPSPGRDPRDWPAAADAKLAGVLEDISRICSWTTAGDVQIGSDRDSKLKWLTCVKQAC